MIKLFISSANLSTRWVLKYVSYIKKPELMLKFFISLLYVIGQVSGTHSLYKINTAIVEITKELTIYPIIINSV
jgi:hypothetical protein